MHTLAALLSLTLASAPALAAQGQIASVDVEMGGGGAGAQAPLLGFGVTVPRSSHWALHGELNMTLPNADRMGVLSATLRWQASTGAFRPYAAAGPALISRSPVNRVTGAQYTQLYAGAVTAAGLELWLTRRRLPVGTFAEMRGVWHHGNRLQFVAGLRVGLPADN